MTTEVDYRAWWRGTFVPFPCIENQHVVEFRDKLMQFTKTLKPKDKALCIAQRLPRMEQLHDKLVATKNADGVVEPLLTLSKEEVVEWFFLVAELVAYKIVQNDDQYGFSLFVSRDDGGQIDDTEPYHLVLDSTGMLPLKQ